MEAMVAKKASKILNNVNKLQANDPYIMGGISAIQLPPDEGNPVFHIICTMFQLFKLKGLFSGLDHENPQEHLWNFIDVSRPFSLKKQLSKVSQAEVIPILFDGEGMQVAGWISTWLDNFVGGVGYSI